MTGTADTWVERTSWILVAALAFSLPFEKGIQVAGIGTVSRWLGQAAFLAGAAAVIQRRSLRPPNAALLVAALFVFWGGATWFWSYSRPLTATRLVTMAQLLGMAWLIWETCRTRPRVLQLVEAYVAGAAVSSIWTISRAVLNRQTNYRRFATAGFDPNDLGVTLVIAIAFAFYLNVHLRGAWAWLARLAAALSIYALILTASRTALVASVACVVFVPLMWRGSTLVQRTCTLALVALIAIGPVQLVPRATRARLATLPEEATEGTFHDRTRIWKAGLQLFERRPAIGVGLGAYPQAAYPILKIHYNAHNTPLSVMVESGVVGVALWAGLMAVLIWYVRLLPRDERALWITTLVVWFVGTLAVAWEHRKPTWLIFALIMSAAARAFEPQERGS